MDGGVIQSVVGGNVSVLCRYSPQHLYKTNERWCRFRDAWCVSVEGSDSQVQVIDDVASLALTVVMREVSGADRGWYWCEVGDLQTPVYLDITEASTSTKGYIKIT